MPRYYFDTCDGRRVCDPEGSIHLDDLAARREGLSLLGEILRYQGDEFWKTGHFAVIVKNEAGGEIVALNVTVACAQGETPGAPDEPPH